MTTRVVIPWQAGCPYREAALDWVTRRYRERHPEWDGPWVIHARPGPWIKATAISRGVTDLNRDDIVIIADADIWTDGIPAAVQAVRDGAAWAIPHRGVHRLTEASTRAVLDGSEPHQELERAERPYAGVPGGGAIVLTAGLLERTPMDPRFRGWGQEDESWGLALTAIAGSPWRGKAPLFHLWHPAPERMTRRRGNPEGWRLYRRYYAARETPAAMNLLLEEARVALGSHQPPLHDQQPDCVG